MAENVLNALRVNNTAHSEPTPIMPAQTELTLNEEQLKKIRRVEGHSTGEELVLKVDGENGIQADEANSKQPASNPQSS